jgi:hypothetical protein
MLFFDTVDGTNPFRNLTMIDVVEPAPVALSKTEWNAVRRCAEQLVRRDHGLAQLRITTLIDKIVQRSPSVVASSTRTICRFPCPHRRTIHRNKGAKHVVTSRSRRFFPLLCFASRYHSRKR